MFTDVWIKFHEWLVGGNFTLCLWQNFYGGKTTQSWMKQPLHQVLLVNRLSCYNSACCMSMSIFYARVHSACPIHTSSPYIFCMSMSILHVHVHAPCPCPCPCCMFMLMLHFHVHAVGPCPCWKYKSMSMVHVLVHAVCPCPHWMSMSILNIERIRYGRGHGHGHLHRHG
jgi:hypothetical protein